MTYYLFSNRSCCGHAALVWFERGKHEWKAYFIRLSKSEFEGCLLRQELVLASSQATLPPWISELEGLSLDTVEAGRVSRVKTYRARAETRFEAISQLTTLEMELAIDLADDAEKEIVKRLKEADRAGGAKLTNRHRLILWYCAYRVHGKRLEALMPAYVDIGKWDRRARTPEAVRLGRPVLRKGAATGHSAIPLAQRITDSYIKYSDSAIAMTAIHREAMVKEFGCKIVKGEDGNKRFYHERGEAYPSYQQYRYWVLKEFGTEFVQRRRFGEERYRSRVAAQKGSFSEQSANYCERVESDCYYVPELPTQLLSEQPGSPLAVCRTVCSTTGIVTGIGFSYGAERAEAYRLAKFSAALPKAEFGRLFGITIDEADWPGSGLPPREILDRGPGSSSAASGSCDVAPAIRELAQSYSGQAKATVEASHPRTTSLEGAPTYVQSSMNVFQLAKREVMRVIADNQSSTAASRLTPEMIAAGVAANPVAMTSYLLARGRSDAIPISREQAIREFLDPVTFILKDDGIWLDGMPFSHSHLHEQGLPARVPKGQKLEIKGYVYPVSLYLAWVEVGGRLHEVQSQLRIRDNPEQRYMTLLDLLRYSQKLRELRANQREHGAAAIAEMEQKFRAETGLDWNAGSRRSGKPPPRRGRREQVPIAGAKRPQRVVR